MRRAPAEKAVELVGVDCAAAQVHLLQCAIVLPKAADMVGTRRFHRQHRHSCHHRVLLRNLFALRIKGARLCEKVQRAVPVLRLRLRRSLLRQLCRTLCLRLRRRTHDTGLRCLFALFVSLGKPPILSQRTVAGCEHRWRLQR